MESSSPHNGLAPSTLMSAPSREPLLRGWVKWSRMTSLYRSSSAMCLRSLHSLPSLLSLPRHSRLVKIDPAVDLGRLGRPGRLGRLIVAPVQALARTARAPREVRAPEHRYHC